MKRTKVFIERCIYLLFDICRDSILPSFFFLWIKKLHAHMLYILDVSSVFWHFPL